LQFPSSAAPAVAPCKICGEPAPFYGMADFNRGCLEAAQASMGGFANCDTYDPFTPGFDTPPAGTYTLVTCFETMEHTPDPGACVQAIMDRLAEAGVVVFSTLLQPDDMDKIGMRWWYIGRRNGHISLHSKKSLKLLWERYGCVVESVDEDVHMASRSAVSERLQLGGTADSAA